MKAAIRRSYGLPDAIKIEDVEKPIPNENQLLIKVHACTVNRTDCAMLSAKPFIMRFVLGLLRPRKIRLGTDFAGEVVAIGANVQTFGIGDRVFGFNDFGYESQAEYTLTTVENLFPIPEKIDYPLAAASLEGAHYAFSFIHKVNIQAGQKILINGATGGIGSALLQFVRQYEVKITATCNAQNIGLIQSLGADNIIDYTQEDFTEGVDTYDYIFDTVGKSTFGKCQSILTENGIYISSELGPYSQNVLYPLLTSFTGKKVIFPIPYHTRETIPYISRLLEAEKFRPVLDRTYGLDDIGEAYEYVMQGQKTGNVLIDLALGQQ